MRSALDLIRLLLSVHQCLLYYKDAKVVDFVVDFYCSNIWWYSYATSTYFKKILLIDETNCLVIFLTHDFLFPLLGKSLRKLLPSKFLPTTTNSLLYIIFFLIFLKKNSTHFLYICFCLESIKAETVLNVGSMLFSRFSIHISSIILAFWPHFLPFLFHIKRSIIMYEVNIMALFCRVYIYIYILYYLYVTISRRRTQDADCTSLIRYENP